MRIAFGGVATDLFPLHSMCQPLRARGKLVMLYNGCRRFVRTSCRFAIPGASLGNESKAPPRFLRDKKISKEDINKLYRLFEQSSRLTILTGAGVSTKCGIPNYISPNGAYSSGFKPITHQEFTRSSRARRRCWARSYAGWRRFTAAQPGPAHPALASLEKAGRIDFMITQNVDRLHHRAGSDPLELHGTVYTVICLDCGFSFPRDSFQDQLKALNPMDSHQCKP